MFIKGEVIRSGPGLTFIVYPQALAKLPVAPLWYVVFSRKNRTLIIKSQQIIVRGRVRAHFKAMVILYLEKR